MAKGMKLELFTQFKMTLHVPAIKVVDPAMQQKKLAAKQPLLNLSKMMTNLNKIQKLWSDKVNQAKKELNKTEKAKQNAGKANESKDTAAAKDLKKAAENKKRKASTAKQKNPNKRTKKGRKQIKRNKLEKEKVKKQQRLEEEREKAAVEASTNEDNKKEKTKKTSFAKKTGAAAKNLFPLEAAKKQLGSLYKFSQDAVGAASNRISAERLLQAKMNNQTSGMTPERGREMSSHADTLQKNSTISAVSGIGGMTELSESVMDPKNIMKMTGSMYDLAASTHGAKVSQEQIISTASAMGEAMKGKITSLEGLGIEFTKQQEEVMKYGTEIQRTQTLVGLLESQVGGVAAAMAETPEGKILQLQNAWVGVQETLGSMLMPSLMTLFDFILANMPLIEMVMTTAFLAVSEAINFIVNALQLVFAFIADNWAWIQPILIAIATVFITAIIIQLFVMAAAWLAAAAPILLIIGVVALLMGAVLMLGGTVSDIVGGIIETFALLFAHLWNIVANLWNLFATLAEFLVNVFIDPAYAIDKLFRDMGIAVLQTVFSIVRGIEDMVQRVATLLNKLGMNIDVSGSFDLVKGKIEDKINELENKNPQTDKKVLELARMELKDPTATANAGFNYGRNLAEKTAGKLDGFMPGDGKALGKDIGSAIPSELPMTSSPGTGLSGLGASPAGREPNIAQVGKVGEVGKINKEVDISQEDLKLMRDLAEIKAIQNFVTLTPTVQVTTGDIVEKADLDDMIRRFQQSMEQEIAYAARGVYG